MQKVNVPILGLTSSSEARAVTDGESRVLHNMTIESGGTKVVPPPSRTIVSSTYRRRGYFHEKVGQWLYIESGGIVKNEKGNRINSDGIVTSLSFMGNIVVMYCADGVRYAIFDGNYRYLGMLPTLPELQIGIKPVHVTTLSDEKYYSDTADIAESNEGLRWMNASKGYFDECLSALYTQGAFIDRTLFRMAARLFDGSYVCYSPIYYVEDSDTLIQNIGYAWLGTGHTIGRDNKNFFSRPRSTTGSSLSQYFTSVRGFLPTLHPAACDLRRWRDIIVAIELFATPSIMGHESKSTELGKKNEYNLDTGSVAAGATVQLTTVNGYDRYVWKGAKKIREEVADASLFYKIAEFDLEGKETWRLENTSPSQLAVQTRLPISEQPHVLSDASYKYIYNGKMHLAGVTERFSELYDNYAIAGRVSTDEGIIQITSVVSIDTEQGERKVITTSNAPKLYKKDGVFLLPPLLHYCDARAKNLRICIAYTNGFTSTAVRKDFPLTAHKSLNLAYYLNEARLGEEDDIKISCSDNNLVVEVENSTGENAFVTAVKNSGTYIFTKTGTAWNLTGSISKDGVFPGMYGLRMYLNGAPEYGTNVKEGTTITVNLTIGGGELAGIKPIEIKNWAYLDGQTEADFKTDSNDNTTGFTLKEAENREYTRKNVMRVSSVDNPFFFPAASTYSFDADIVAVCSNTVTVSQGQFGQHPLYVFTNEGVWLMSVDVSGAGSYLAQIPCSREICNNAAGVAVTTRGVVFPTAKGLMLINGSEVVNISSALAGLHTPELVHDGDVVERICDVVGKGELVARGAFLDYLKNGFIAFDYNANLLYVCNSGYNFAWVYNMEVGAWCTVDGQYDHYIPYSSNMVLGGYQDTNNYYLYHFDNDQKRVSDVPVVMVTRGCIFGETGFKRVGECAIRGTFLTHTAGFYVLGSVDGVSWELIGGREVNNGARAAVPLMVRDLVTRFKHSRSYRYIAFAFVGKVRSDAKLLMCEAMVESTWGNRVR